MSQDQLDMEFGYDLIDNGTSDDYYTPPWLFKALNVEFDLDVCAPAGGVPWIPAKRSLSIIDDGLNTEWQGRVWMNPPYSAPTLWIDKFIEHGNGICLIACSKSAWFYHLLNYADGICGVPTVNMKFITAGGEAKPIFMPVILAAMGAINVQVMRDSNLSRVR